MSNIQTSAKGIISVSQAGRQEEECVIAKLLFFYSYIFIWLF